MQSARGSKLADQVRNPRQLRGLLRRAGLDCYVHHLQLAAEHELQAGAQPPHFVNEGWHVLARGGDEG